MREVRKSAGLILLTLCLTLFALFVIKELTLHEQQRKLGVQAVKLMYQFVEIEQLQFNMIELQTITTDAVFNQLTIDNEDRALYTYVKFLGLTTHVDVIKSTSTYVLYRLVNDNVDEDRRFIFMFDCDSSGKISYVREAEIYDFVTYSD